MKKTLALLLSLLFLLSGCSEGDTVTQAQTSAEASTDEQTEAAVEDDAKEDYYLSYPEIVDRLYTLDTLAGIPSEGESCLQYSSYDRNSYYDEETDSYVNWDANLDGWGYIRKTDDGGGIVIAEMYGAGFINRVRTDETVSTGRIKIYIDDSEKPVINMPFKDFVSYESGKFPYDYLCYPVARGRAMYVPITYNSYCRVELYGGWGNFYLLGYTSISSDYTVEPFSYPLSAENAAALEKANEILHIAATPLENTVGYTLSGGESAVIYTDNTSGAVTNLQLKLTEYESDFDALRELSIASYWDGANYSSVNVSLGDYFDTPAGITPHLCLPVGVLDDGTMYSRWYMPYENGAKIVVTNNGENEISFTAAYESEKISTAKARSLMRFCAKWAVGRKLTEEDRSPDALYMSITGKGAVVGLMMHNYQVADNCWWGEGDEKFFIDGEKFPSWFGTGSEDYFGFGYASAETFSYPFHSQTRVGEFDAQRYLESTEEYNTVQALMHGNKVLSRWHITDPIVFRQSIDICFENYEPFSSVQSSVCLFFYVCAENTEENAASEYKLTSRCKYFKADD